LHFNIFFLCLKDVNEISAAPKPKNNYSSGNISANKAIKPNKTEVEKNSGLIGDFTDLLGL